MKDLKKTLVVGPGGVMTEKNAVVGDEVKAIKKIPFIPSPGTLLVAKLAATDYETESGLVIKGEDNKAVVVAVGPGVEFYEPGDVVVVNVGHGNIMFHSICEELYAPLYPGSLIGKYTEEKIPVV
jgi:co-chaperonin GroES (HSP10)